MAFPRQYSYERSPCWYFDWNSRNVIFSATAAMILILLYFIYFINTRQHPLRQIPDSRTTAGALCTNFLVQLECSPHAQEVHRERFANEFSTAKKKPGSNHSYP